MKRTANLFLFFSLITTGIVSNLIPGLVTELQAAESVSMSNKFTTLNQTIDAHAKEAAKLTKELTGAIERARKIESPDEAQIQANDTLEKAKNWLTQVNTSIETTRAYLNTLINAEKIKTSAEKSLAKTSEASQLKSLDRLSVDELNNLNNQIVLDLENERNRRNTLEAQLNKLSDRREIMVAEISQFNNRQASLKQPAVVDASGKPKNGTQPGGQDLIKSIETLFINQKRLELEWEQRSFDIRRSILRNERQLAEKNVFSFEKNAAVIQEALNLARTKSATASISSAETSSKKFSSSHPVLQEVLNTNQKLAAETAEISVTITALSVDKHAIEQDLDRYQQSFNTIKDKISSAGLSETIGIRLRNAKNQLPDLSAFTQRIEKRRSVIEEVQLRRIDLEDRSLELVNIPREVNNRLSTVVFTDELTRKQTKQQLELLLNEQKNQFLANALKTYDNYFEKTLVPLFEKEKEYVKLINDYTTYINERILWVKSSQIITPNDFIQSLKSLLWLITPSSWVTVISNLLEIADNNLFYTIAVSLLFVAIFFVRPFLVRQMKQYGRYKTKLSLAKFSDSLMAGLLTLLLAAYWPLLLWLIALSILNSQTAEVFTRAVAEGLLASANVLFFVFLFMQIVRGSGLAESHFRWKAATISLIKKQLLWFGALIIPFVFILQTTNNQPIQTHFDTLGRLAFIAITLLLTILIYRLVNPRKGIFKDELQQHKD
ncbi:MAG: hypothetical protein OEX07_12645, partial [Gammaproteobacteria bacterium]|nr:hypothetical protein [Gammaproteobacteria bacterium]